MSEKKWPTWLISYNLDGDEWSMSIVAENPDDAMRRLKQAATWGRLDGQLVASIPLSRGGFLIPLVCWWQNLWLKRKL